MGMMNRLNEAIKVFRNKGDRPTDKQAEKQTGEGVEELMSSVGYGHQGLGSFNLFRSQYINETFKNEVDKIMKYRRMLSAPEISDVVEDAVNESTQEDDQGYIINYEIYDESITKKEQVMKTLNDEFYGLFYNRLNIEDNLWDWMYTYFVDGRVYIENVVNEAKHKEGLINSKLLPSDTMDYAYNYKTGRIDFYMQYLKTDVKKPTTRADAEKDENIIVFEPSQINFIPFQYGRNKKSIIGYLEKCRIPYNILKLLETSLVIYRLVRAPERLVFKIDVGNMPREKGMKFVEKVKQKMNKKEMFDPNTGTLVNTGEILCIRQSTEIKLLDGRTLPLTDIIEEYNQGKENWVYSINQETQEIEPGKITNAKITRKNEKLVRIHLDDGSYHDVTYDHKFIMRDGTEKRSDQLQENDSLMPLYTKSKKIGKLDYECIYDPGQNKWITTHRKICEYTQRKIIKRMGYEEFNDFKQKENIVYNHKISKIEYLEEKDDTGCITVEGNHNFAISFNGNSTVFIKNSVLDNYFIPQGESRGSDISTVGGQTGAFQNLDDIHYFHKKLYRALKYPMSRVEKQQTDQSGDVLLHGRNIGEISRDEIKWGSFLERQQSKFSKILKKMFLLHLEFKGLKQQYGINKDNLQITFTPPSNYKEQMEQAVWETRVNNYTSLSREDEFPKYWLMKTQLMLDDDQIQELSNGKKKDKDLGLVEEDGRDW